MIKVRPKKKGVLISATGDLHLSRDMCVLDTNVDDFTWEGWSWVADCKNRKLHTLWTVAKWLFFKQDDGFRKGFSKIKRDGSILKFSNKNPYEI